MTIFRDIMPSDFEDLVEIYFHAYEELKENPDLGIIFFRSKPTMAQELQWFSNLYKGVEEGNTVVTVAAEDSRVVGTCDVNRLRPNTNLSHRGVLGILVREGYRGRGIGERLLNETLRKCRGKFEMIELTVFSVNRARKLYERVGFRTYGHLPQAIKRGERYYDEELMYLKL